jgi:hypothetical protein
MNFKEVQIFGKNLTNSPFDLIFRKLNLVGHTGMEEIQVTTQVPKDFI